MSSERSTPPTPNLARLEAWLLALLATPSPTGFTDAAVAWIEAELDTLGLTAARTPKGALGWTLPGRGDAPPLALLAHLDTLGAMVTRIKESGRLGLTQLGSYAWTSVEGADVVVNPATDGAVTGTVVLTKASTHVHGSEVNELERSADTLEVRLDAAVHSAADVRALGIEVGDPVAVSSREAATAAGYIKGRHLDDKACVAVALEATAAYLDAGRKPAGDVHVFLSVHEEVGHGGAAGIPADATELLVLDMAPIGEGQRSSEHHVSICAKDRGGPYDAAMVRRLVRLADRHGIEARRDVYPHYASDASAAWRGGRDAPAALIGPGVDASHAYERTHRDALEATANLVLAYLEAGAGADE